MHSLIAKTFNAAIQHVLPYTLYDMVHSSDSFEDVKLALNHRIDWSIELFRSCLTIHLINDSNFTMLTMSFLLMAETIHIHYGRLSAPELKERVKSMGCATFVLLFVILDIAFVVIRVAGLVVLSGTSRLATSLVLISISPSVVLLLLTYAGRLVTGCRGRAPGSEGVEV